MKLTVDYPSDDIHGAEIATVEKVFETKDSALWSVTLTDGVWTLLFSEQIKVSA